jgi:hypothetical protein
MAMAIRLSLSEVDSGHGDTVDPSLAYSGVNRPEGDEDRGAKSPDLEARQRTQPAAQLRDTPTDARC